VKNKKLLIVCPYPLNTAPSQRLKYEQYISFLRDNGFAITIKPFMSISFWNIIYLKGYLFRKILSTMSGYLNRIILIFKLRSYDVVYIHLWVTPFGLPFFEWIYCKFCKKVIYDIDDLIYVGNSSNENSFIALLKGKNKAIHLIRCADHVITCTPYLDAFVKKYNQSTTDISSTINTEKYIPLNKYSNESPLTLGWSGSHSTVKYFYLLRHILKSLSLKYSFRILVIGETNIQIDGLDIESVPWSDADEVKQLQRIDIGLYPLPDETWVNGKSGLKALQYMALGIPTVATAAGANFRIIINGESGLLVKTEMEWIQCLSDLIENAALRKKIGNTARKRVEENFSVKANQAVYLKILRQVSQ
jgi:L-malate glycosyltransferase